MKISSKPILIFAALVTIILTTSCSETSTAVTATAFPITKTTILIPSRTITLTIPPEPTPTTTPTNTSTPIPTLTRIPAPLNDSGPWLFLEQHDQNSKTYEPIICDWDGASCQKINLPALPSNSVNSYSYPAISPRNGYLTFLIAATQKDPELWIMKLPGIKPVQKIPLLSDKVKTTLPDRIDPYQEIVFYNSVFDPFNVIWSPDGRYMAFVAAIEDANTDVHVYDSAKKTIRRLTTEPESVRLMGWSPDSQWLVFSAVERYSWEGTFTKAVGAVNMAGQEKYPLYEYPQGNEYKLDLYREIILDWTIDHSFLVETIMFEDGARNLREVNLNNSSVKNLYSGTFSWAGLDKKNQVAYFNVFEITSSKDPAWGLHQLNIRTGEIIKRFTSPEWSEYWSPELSAFIAEKSTNQGNITQVIGVDGKLKFELPGRVQISPDDNWIILTSSPGINLYDKNGTFINKWRWMAILIFGSKTPKAFIYSVSPMTQTPMRKNFICIY